MAASSPLPAPVAVVSKGRAQAANKRRVCMYVCPQFYFQELVAFASRAISHTGADITFSRNS